MYGFSFQRPSRNYWKTTHRPGRTVIEAFTPQMFTICMGTGILAVQMQNNPYQFHGLGVLSIIVWVLDLILFAIISLSFIARWIFFTPSTSRMFESDVEQTTYLSTTAIATATLVELVSFIVGSTWKNWQYVCFAFWWGTVAVALVAGTITYWLLIRDEEVHLSNLSPTLMYPTTGLVATASAGSVLINYTPLSIGLSMPVLVVSYILLGAGFFLAILTITAYFTRLLSHQTPPAKKVAAQLIPVAALANAAYAYDTLGYLAGPKRHILEYYGKGPLADPAVGNGVYAAGFVLGITIWGFATLWLLLAVIAFFRDITQTKFNMNMWSGAYPMGAYGIACSQFSVDFNSPTFRVLTSIILVVQLLYWFYLVAFTLPMLISGELLLGEPLEHLKEEQEEEREERQRSESRSSIRSQASSPA